MQILSIDLGNTYCKAAIYKGSLFVSRRFNTSEIEDSLAEILSELEPNLPLHVGWISVANEIKPDSWDLWSSWKSELKFQQIKSTDSLPISNLYQSPATLGVDRIVAVIGARQLYPDRNILVIDMGTAITYDLGSKENEYLGGGIAPGLEMRFNALKHFTQRLPLVKAEGEILLPGNTTDTSIRSGVWYGIIAEVDGMIERYRDSYGQNLIAVLTGGDSIRFEKRLKNINFAHPNLIHRGIRHILMHKPTL